MLRLLQQYKTALRSKAFALHSAGGAPLPPAPGAPLPAPGPMAAAAVLGVLKGGSTPDADAYSNVPVHLVTLLSADRSNVDQVGCLCNSE